MQASVDKSRQVVTFVRSDATLIFWIPEFQVELNATNHWSRESLCEPEALPSSYIPRPGLEGEGLLQNCIKGKKVKRESKFVFKFILGELKGLSTTLWWSCDKNITYLKDSTWTLSPAYRNFKTYIRIVVSSWPNAIFRTWKHISRYHL